MKKILVFLLFFATSLAFSQEDAWVYFNDKLNAANYFSNPLLMLSQRSLDRRNAQNIPLDFKDIPISQNFVNQVGLQTGITVKAQSKWLNAVHVRGTVLQIQALENLSFVDHVYFANKALNATVSGRISGTTKTQNAQKTNDVQANYNYGNSNNQITMLNGHLLHQQDFTGSGKIIAVLDAGFPGVNSAQPFQRLLDNNLILGGYNFVAGTDNFYTGGSHGTSVLSTMGGYTENQLIGTAPNAAYYLFITEDVSSENPVEESYWVEAAEKADSLGVDVITTSLGYFGYDNANYSYTYDDMNGSTSFVSRGADIAFSRGMVVVVAAGNSGTSSNPHISVPADAFSVLTVGAVDAGGQYAAFSSIGPSFDGRIKPDVMAKGVSSTISDTSGTITSANGTSFATPITAGLVACLWQALPEKTNTEIVQLIKQSASFYANPNAQYGYGIPNFSQALLNGLSVGNFAKKQFICYPNPVVNALSFVFPNGFSEAEITIYDILGQEIVRKTISTTSPALSLEKLPPGMYVNKIQSGTFSQTGKFLKK